MINVQGIINEYTTGPYQSMQSVAERFGCTREYIRQVLRKTATPNRARPKKEKLAPRLPLPCGTFAAYRRGCRCEWCKAASAEATRLRRQKKK